MNIVFGRTHQVWITCVVAMLLGCSKNAQKTDAVSSQLGNSAAADIQINDPKPYPFRFVAYGDMRFAERASYGGKVIANAEARQQVIAQIANEDPAFLVVTGDFVFRGFHAEDWTYFERGIKPVRDRGTQIFPAIGNHEVGPFPSKTFGSTALQEIVHDTEQHIASRGLENYYKEFPNVSSRPWYSILYANSYFLVLDSEIDGEQSKAAQLQWIRTQLDSIPSGIDYVFVALHRPPHTALTDDVHKPPPWLTDLSTLLEDHQKKSRARIVVIAGHVHNYERYEYNNVSYIVSGGGGAAQVKVVRSADDRYPGNALYGKNDPINEEQGNARNSVESRDSRVTHSTTPSFV
jgi:acid phosphatase type 7